MYEILLNESNCLSLFISSTVLSLAYTALSSQLILRNCSHYDRFTLSLTLVGILGMLMDTGAAIGAYIVSRRIDRDISNFSMIYLISQLNWFSSILLSVNFLIFAFKLNA